VLCVSECSLAFLCVCSVCLALQNNLHELWALLSFLMPDIFNSGADFDSMFSASEVDPDVSAKLLEQLHKILRPFMLRRLKSQVATDLPPKKETLLFVGMSELQAKLYRGVLERDIDAVLGRVKEKSRLMNSQ
jgi:SWI/SNF-related matrix-associated actin-dependent regulator of chromatin subfamily A member 5